MTDPFQQQIDDMDPETWARTAKRAVEICQRLCEQIDLPMPADVESLLNTPLDQLIAERRAQLADDGCLCWVGHGDCGGCSGVIGITHEPACGWEWNPQCPVHNPPGAQLADDGCFIGHQPRACGEHRTTGERAWCYDCHEWCYPHHGCIRCRHPEG